MIYVFDADPDYVTGLKNAGIDAEAGSFGHSMHRPLEVFIDKPPHESNAFVYNLTKPVCYDYFERLQNRNTNDDVYKLAISPIEDYYKHHSSGDSKERPRFQLIPRTSFDNSGYRSKFGIKDVMKAVSDGGIPLIVFLNPEHARHAYPKFIDWLGANVECSKTTANEVFVPETILSAYPRLAELNKGSLAFKMPMAVKCTPISKDYYSPHISAPTTVITNRVNDVFCQFIMLGKGLVFLCPQLADPVAGTKKLLEMVPEIATTYLELQKKSVVASRNPIVEPLHPLQPSTQIIKKKRGVFISHIGEEASIAEALKSLLLSEFGPSFPVFVSSDYTSIRSGSDWHGTVITRLKELDTVIVLISHESINQNWINYEAGLGEGADANVIPIVIRGFSKSDLKQPISRKQARDLHDLRDMEALLVELGFEASTMSKHKLAIMAVDGIAKNLPPPASKGTLQKPEVKVVDLHYPTESGLQEDLRKNGYEILWSNTEMKAGYEIVVQDLEDGSRIAFKNQSNQSLLKRKAVEK